MSRPLLNCIAWSACVAGTALILSGCAEDRGERAYYRTRYVPENIDGTYTGIQRAQWKGDKEVFELPAAPPALDGEHYARVNCEKPGPRFKGQAMVGLGDEVRGDSRIELAAIGAMDTRPVPVGALDPLPGYAIGGMHDGAPHGIYDTTMPKQDIAVMDSRPRVIAGSGTDVREPPVDAYIRDMAKDDYCLPEEVTPLKSPKK